jgi:low affinity Fe/Cu permease
MNEIFRHVAKRVSEWAGRAWTFILALVVIIVWWFTGPLFGFSDTWQLVINTGTTIVTFLMVFLIQNTQNRESKAVNLKLDELIRSIRGARNTIMDVEELSDEELNKLEQIYVKISHEKHRRHKSTEETSQK